MKTLGGVEAGGSKWNCAIGTSPADVRATATIRTTSPEETIGHVVAFFESEGPVDAVGIGCFGPIDQRSSSPTWGYITTTPKPGWAHTDVAQEIRRRLSVPVAFDTDVNAAALGEHRWGAAHGLDTFCYITVGTGIGGGAMVEGSLLHGLMHPEFGHMRIPHDRELDPFDGICPYHGDCWEGLASGRAIEARWGRAADELQSENVVWELQATYLALGLVSVTCVLSPQRIVLGGGVMTHPRLLELVRERIGSILNGYLSHVDEADGYLTCPALGPRAGVLGAIALAEALAAQPPDHGA